MERVELLWTRGRGFEPAPYVLLGELTGFAEQAVAGVSTLSALALLDGMLLAADGSGSFPASRLAAPDRDRLLARVYLRSFGSRVESTLECAGCGEPFDLDFDLAELLESLEAAPADRGEAGADASVLVLAEGPEASAAGARFRLPTGEDELAVAGLPPREAEAQLARRCLLEPGGAGGGEDPAGHGEGFFAALEEHLARTAPLLDCELDAGCPNCGAASSVRFDVQHYLLTLLTAERPRLSNEVHRLASAYGWSLAEILSLPRDDRRALVERVEADLAARAGAPL